jgi:long-chain acyl-CoA synthetase
MIPVYDILGGAATSLPVLRFFEDIGIPIVEGYGLTESSPIICASTTSWINRKTGTCGVPLSGVTVKIVNPETLEDVVSGDGEICVAGPNVMVGYRNNAKANAEAFFVKDGMRFLRTGDIGQWDGGKFLRITGRLKEQFKLLNGKYVVPIPLEDTLCRSQYIAQALLYGDNRPFTVALIVPNAAEIRLWAGKNQIHGADSIDLAMLIQNKAVHSLITSEITKKTSALKSYERPARWAVVIEAFSQENQMMTPKMSLRRNNIIKAYLPLIESIYSGKDGYAVFPAPKDGGDSSSSI